MQARRRAQPSGTNSPSSSHPRLKHRARCVIFDPCPPCGRQGRPGQGFLAGSNIRAAGERPPRARPQRRGSPGPIPNPAVKPAFAESTAARGCGRAGRRARGGRFSICAERGPRGDRPLRAFARLGGNLALRCWRRRAARASRADFPRFGSLARRGPAHIACAEVPQRGILSVGLSAF